MAHGIKTRRRACAGLAIVEMALVLPLLMLLTFALCEMSWAFFKADLVSNAARNAARVAILPQSTNTDVLNSVSASMTAGGMAATGYSVTITPGNVATASVGTSIQVQITVPYSKIALTGYPLIPLPSQLQAASSMAKEGP
jgi:Flp pilus assembly protein TadG